MAATVGQPRAKALHELLSHHMVNIYVGNDNTHWILHEKLLCAKSKYFHQRLFTKHVKPGEYKEKTFGLPDEEDAPFTLFVGWLYSGRVPKPEEEKDLGDLYDLYQMAEKWQIADLIKEVLDTVRTWYRTTDTYPGLRRVQYVYANTDEDSPMRQLLVSCIARMLVLGDSLPTHWEKALSRNGELAVDMIRAITLWKLSPEEIPDAREEPQKIEKEKVKVAEKSDDEQERPSKEEQANDESDDDTAVSASQDLEKHNA